MVTLWCAAGSLGPLSKSAITFRACAFATCESQWAMPQSVHGTAFQKFSLSVKNVAHHVIHAVMVVADDDRRVRIWQTAAARGKDPCLYRLREATEGNQVIAHGHLRGTPPCQRATWAGCASMLATSKHLPAGTDIDGSQGAVAVMARAAFTPGLELARHHGKQQQHSAEGPEAPRADRLCQCGQ